MRVPLVQSTTYAEVI